MIFDLHADHAVLLADGDLHVLGEGTARVPSVLFVVDLHELEVIDDAVADRHTLHKRDVFVRWTLDRARAGDTG